MQRIQKLFGEIKMTWLKVILFAIIVGIYTGVVMLIPFLKDTSFQDIGCLYEWWVIFAFIIVVNCEKGWEAALKCFVFFLISQPLVYLVQIAFGSLSFEDGWRYYSTIWFRMTLLTLPGGFIAYLAKKQNVLGAIILGLGNGIQAVLAVAYAAMCIQAFPHHLLSIFVCIGSIIVMTLGIQKERKGRIIAFVIPCVLALAIPLVLTLTGRSLI